MLKNGCNEKSVHHSHGKQLTGHETFSSRKQFKFEIGVCSLVGYPAIILITAHVICRNILGFVGYFMTYQSITKVVRKMLDYQVDAYLTKNFIKYTGHLQKEPLVFLGKWLFNETRQFRSLFGTE